MATTPTHVPTEWVGTSSRGRTFLIISVVFVSTAFVSVVLRLIARLTSIRKLLVDDYLCIIAQIFAFGLMAEAVLFTKYYAMGWHIVDVPPAQAEKFFQAFFAAELIYGVLTCLYKLAVIFLYRSVFGEIRSFNIASWVIICLSVGWWLGGALSTVFQCNPVSRGFTPTEPGQCINQEAYILGNGICNLLLDVIILLYPLPVIWGLNLSTRKKVALTAMFLIGCVVCIASILRIASSFPLNFTDPTYSLWHIAVWSQVEPSIGIIAACLPTLRQFLFRHIGGGSRKGTQNKKYGSRTTDNYQSISKSNTIVALTGWNSNEVYTEVTSSPSATPKSSAGPPPDIESGNFTSSDFPSSFLNIDPSGPRLTEEDPDQRSIVVKKEVTVTTE